MAPKTVGDTRFDGAVAGPGMNYTYLYTLYRTPAAKIDARHWQQDFVPTVRAQMKTSPGLIELFRAGVTVHFRYRGQEGKLIQDIVMTPAESLAK